jgi:hypothetical protein
VKSRFRIVECRDALPHTGISLPEKSFLIMK